MALTNTITLAGNLTADPELKYSQDGKPYCRVTIAVNPREFDRTSKEWKDGTPVFWRGTLFGDLAEHVGHSLRKGQRVLAYGTVKTDEWTDRDSGTKRSDKALQIEEIGASLLYSNVEVTRSAPRQDADTSAPQSQPSYGDDTPF